MPIIVICLSEKVGPRSLDKEHYQGELCLGAKSTKICLGLGGRPKHLYDVFLKLLVSLIL